MKVFLNPIFTGEDKGDGGVRRVVEAQIQHLPSFGWDVIASPASADVLASHIVLTSQLERIHDKPLALHNHGLYWHEFEWPNWSHKVNKEIMKAVRRADAVTAPSEWVAQSVRRNSLRQVDVIGHGINLDEWPYSRKSQGYVLWNKTRVDPVCTNDAMNELARRAPDVSFVATLADESIPNMKVTGVVPYEEAKGFVARAGVYLCNVRETFGIGTLEAMASGVPVLGWRWGGQEDIVEHQLTGYLAEPGDYDDLLAGLRYCLKYRDEMGHNARQVIEDRYQWKDVIGKYALLYETMLAESKRARPKVSVIVPAYNLAEFLPATLDSVKAQIEQDWECIIVDDASPDDTAKIARRYRKEDKRFRLVQNKENKYLAGALNVGISKAKGKFILPLDADNLIAPTTLEELSAPLLANRNLHIAYGAVLFVDADGVTPTVYQGNEKSPGHSGWPPVFRSEWQVTAHAGDGRPANLVPSTSLYRREVWELTGGYRRRYRTAEDADFWTRATSYGFLAKRVTNSDTLIYRNREESMSRVEELLDWQRWLPWSQDLALPPAAIASVQAPPVPSHDPPLISVVIPVGPAHTELVVDALDSVDAQNLRDWECIVVNDSGKQIPWLPSWARLITTSGELGVAAARNLGIEAARAPLFVPLDADDALEPLALATFFGMHQDLGGYVYSDFYERWEGKKATVWEVSDYDGVKLMTEGCLHAVTALYRKSDWEQVGGFDESLPAWEDWDFQLALCEIGVCGTRAPWPLFTYRKDTGIRREKNYAEFESSREGIYSKWREYYEGRKKLMGCSRCPGGGGGRAGEQISQLAAARLAARAPAANRVPENGNVENYVLVIYGGSQQGARFYRPPSGNQYSFSALPTGREKFVHKDDVAFFTSIPDFRVVEKAVPA